MKKEKWNILLIIGLVLIVLSYLFYASIFGIGTFADVFRGYETLHQWQKGGDWNTLSYPRIHGTYSFFVAWWSPGQWMLPYFLELIVGNHFQLIQISLVVLCVSIGLYFYYKLFRYFNFSKQTSLIALLLIVTNQLFYWHFFLFYGGDLFVFAFLPIFIRYLCSLKSPFSLLHILGFIALSIFGIFLKNTFLLFFVVGCFYLILSNHITPIKKWKDSLYLLVSLLLVVGVSFFFFLRHGETPSAAVESTTYNGVSNNLVGDIFYSLGSPMGIITRITPSFQKAAPWLVDLQGVTIVFLLFTVVLTFLLFRFIYLKYTSADKKDFVQISFLFVLPVFLAFDYFYLKDSAISYEMRHFAPLAFLFVPAVIDWINSFKKVRCWLFGALIFISVVDFAGFFIQGNQLTQSRSFVGDKLVNNEEAELLHFVMDWDNSNKNSLLLVENYWFPITGVAKNEKLALRLENDSWTVVSGMELDHAPIVYLNELNLEKYNSIMLISTKQENKLITRLNDVNVKEIKKTEHYLIYLLYK
ncbi:MAG: hypothetical protein ABI207_03425 [Crocinitomicaceae bacterium]